MRLKMEVEELFHTNIKRKTLLILSMVNWFGNIFTNKKIHQKFYHYDPNGAPFTSYPELFRLLMDYEFRMEQLSLINQESIKFSFLKDIKRTYSLYDIAIMTRSSPANILWD